MGFKSSLRGTLAGNRYGDSNDSSKSMELNSIDMAKVVKTGLLIGLSALLTYGLEFAQTVDHAFAPVCMIILSVGIDSIKRLVRNNRPDRRGYYHDQDYYDYEDYHYIDDYHDDNHNDFWDNDRSYWDDSHRRDDDLYIDNRNYNDERFERLNRRRSRRNRTY